MSTRTPTFFRETNQSLVRKLNTLALRVDESVERDQPLQAVASVNPFNIKVAEIVTLDSVNQWLTVRDFNTTRAAYVCLLPSIFTQSTRGAVSYTYSDINTRTATEGGTVETQEITPSLIVGETIQVAWINHLRIYQFMGDGRMWAKTG